jgi:hypothetical protein
MSALYRSAWIVLTISLAINCKRQATNMQSEGCAGAPIDNIAARKLFADHFNALFGELFYQNSASGRHERFSHLEVEALDRHERSAAYWHVAASPPSGLTVSGKVDLCRGWVEIDHVAFAVE